MSFSDTQVNQAEKNISPIAKVTLMLSGLLFGTMMLFSLPAAAECACFCVNGDLKTMCNTVAEAQGQPALCSDYLDKACPTETSSSTSAGYDAPADGATNCRDIRIYDARRGVFTSVKACDVLDAG